MKGYKATYDFKCKNLTYEINNTYTLEGELILCEQGLHFCKNPDDLLDYYPYKSNLKILEIEVLGDVIDEGDKSVTNKLKVLREIPFVEWNDIFSEHSFTKKDKGLEIKRNISDDYWWKYSYDENCNLIYSEDSYDYWWKYSYDENDNLIYSESSTGFWHKYSYDNKGNKIKFENSKDYWNKFTYDNKGNNIYFENSHGYWNKFSYDEKSQLIKRETSYGTWQKYSYDNKGNNIYFENSHGYWNKFSYDERGNGIYFKNSIGKEYKIKIQ